MSATPPPEVKVSVRTAGRLEIAAEVAERRSAQ